MLTELSKYIDKWKEINKKEPGKIIAKPESNMNSTANTYFEVTYSSFLQTENLLWDIDSLIALWLRFRE